MMRRSPEERGFHAYVRHISLDKFPAVAKRLPTVRALKLAGERLNSVNLWIGDGGMRSNLHWDGHDNILLQLTGTKTLLLLPPEATPFGFGIELPPLLGLDELKLRCHIPILNKGCDTNREKRTKGWSKPPKTRG